MEQEFEAFVPAHPKDFALLGDCLASIERFVSPRPRGVTVVAKERSPALDEILQTSGASLMLEDEVLPELRRAQIPSFFCRGEDRSGWYFQQFVKYGLAERSRFERYLVVDADTVFVRPTAFFAQGKAVLYRSRQHHAPYFETFQKLLGYRPARQASFIANYMLLEVRVVRELVAQIEAGQSQRWHELVLSAIDKTTMSSFSEFETYGYYLSRRHPDAFVSRRSATLNLRSFTHPLPGLLRRLASARYHSIAFHNFDR